ncbi:transmembrane protein 248-like [Asterias rubens]|uniref:transmembrane protein 248-like n=1 Tax=Asterias rubens TaxID=7604 RepID=UPI001455C2D6|nr:transmembrane protein 248-like [Asterias rubens]
MAYKPLENLKGHVVSKPPLVIFIACMFLFALSVFILGYYFKHSEVPNYDMSEDWNTFLDDLSSVDFCLTVNESTVTTVLATENPNKLDNNTTISAVTSPSQDEEDDWSMRRNISLSVMVMIDPSIYMAKTITNVTMFSSLIPASLLGKEGSEEMVSVQFEVPHPLKPPQCNDPTVCSLGVQTCLMLTGPASVFPTSRRPATCNTTDSHHENSSAWMSFRPKGQAIDSWCTQGTVAHAKHKFDPHLTVMLSSAEQSLINLHLMYTSYFMFFMVIMWVCYALLKGPPTKQRNVHNTSTEKKIQPGV